MTNTDLIDMVCANQGWTRRDDEIEVPLPGGRTQRITVEAFSDDGHEMTRLTTGVGEAALLSEARMRAALRVNNGLAHGALAIRDGNLVLTDTLPARNATADVLERSLRFVATTADRYENVLFGTDQH